MTVKQAKSEIEYMIKGIKSEIENYENNNTPPRADLTLAIGVLRPKITSLESILRALDYL